MLLAGYMDLFIWYLRSQAKYLLMYLKSLTSFIKTNCHMFFAYHMDLLIRYEGGEL
jgi:hypothetical protein